MRCGRRVQIWNSALTAKSFPSGVQKESRASGSRRTNWYCAGSRRCVAYLRKVTGSTSAMVSAKSEWLKNATASLPRLPKGGLPMTAYFRLIGGRQSK